MADESREFLTGIALIALAIESLQYRQSDDLSSLTKAVREMAPHGSGPTLGHHRSGADHPVDNDILAINAVALADAIIAELNSHALPSPPVEPGNN